jgi:two-component system sensor histidine kinase YesM
MKSILTLISFLILWLPAAAQVGVASDTGDASHTKEINATLTQVQNALRENKSHDEIAAAYFNLGKSYVGAGDLVKAELNYSKAIQESLLGSGKNRAQYYRELGRVQERRRAYNPAALSYTKAAELSSDSVQRKLNLNDAARMKQSSPVEQMVYLNQNAAILSNTTDNYERVQNLNSMANTNVMMNQNPLAIQNYMDALKVVDSASEEAVAIQSNIVDLYVASSDLPAAIEVQRNLVEEAEGNVSAETQIEQLRNLSSLYIKADSTDAALRVLTSAYQTAIRESSYNGALRSVQMLAELYEKTNSRAQADSVMRDFISQSERLIANDKSLFNRQQLSLNEQKIAELERQQSLQEELLSKRNRYNWLLGISVVVLSLLAGAIAIAWNSIRKRNRQIALQSLRREMNPHFIFNSLNSVNEFIAGNNERKANQFLTSYSGLMRNIMENSGKDFIAMDTELDQLKKYLELEKLRFPDKFDYFIEVAPDLNEDEVQIPNMLIQPNVENAIWHGLRYKDSGGWIRVRFFREGVRNCVTIEDNGIGLKESARLKTKNQKLYESRGLKNTEERVRLLNQIYGKGIIFTIEDRTDGGTLARIVW